MTSEDVHLTLSQLSLAAAEAASEDWDRSLRGHSTTESSQEPESSRQGEPRKRTLSELLKLHAEKGKDLDLTPEEANAVAEVLGRWINAESSPFEGEDNFFAARAQDDSALRTPRAETPHEGRPRGQSESVTSKSAS